MQKELLIQHIKSLLKMSQVVVDPRCLIPENMGHYLPRKTLMMKALHESKIYITTEVFCSTNSMVHVTKRTRRRGACFPYPRRTWWAPPYSELLVTRQIYIHFQRAQPHSAVSAWRRRTRRPCKAWATGGKGRHVRTCPDKRLRLLPSVLSL